MRSRYVIAFFLFLAAMGAISVRMVDIAANPTPLPHGTRQLAAAHSRGVILDRHGRPLVHATGVEHLVNEQLTLEFFARHASEQPAVHLIGHLDETGRGATGLESVFDYLFNYAAGQLRALVMIDALGTPLPGAAPIVQNENYLSPAGLQLTIDLHFQRVAEEALRHYQLYQGAVVVLCNATGEILALASSPTFDPTDIAASLACPLQPFFNRALGAYAVGSTFKTFVAAAALQQGISPNHSFYCEGSITVDGSVFRCMHWHAHGDMDMANALALSCNVYFIDLARQLQLQPTLDLLKLFGFGDETPLADGLHGAAGNLPTMQQLQSSGELANFAFGQGLLLATPLQMAAATAAIANGGVYRSPTLIQATIDAYGQATPFQHEQHSRQVIPSQLAAQLRNMMILTVDEGTGQSARPANATAGGKTGTAQSGRFHNNSEILMTSFTGFVPAHNPRYTITVLREDGVSGAQDGGRVFARIANEIMPGF
ncbi:MAG: penicillin-binding protein 2 [Oscillospiraceae bacterium]|nr:penicillin-binding protein 2 [Oscillospiraceae bacterium]